MDLSGKADSLATKMNKITEKFSENIETAEELVLTGDDVLSCVQQKTREIDLTRDDSTPSEIINLDNLVQDF